MSPSTPQQIIGLRKHYFLSKWNVADLLILIVAMADLTVELSLPQSTSRFSPAVLRVVRILRILRVGRVVRLMKVGHLELLWDKVFSLVGYDSTCFSS